MKHNIFVKWTFTLLICFLFSCNKNEKLDTFRKTISLISKRTTEGFSTLDQYYSIEKEKSYICYFKENLDFNSSRLKNLLKINSDGIINKEIITGNENDIQFFSKYIGDITFDNRKFNLFLEFFTVQAAIEKHGHSEIVLFDGKKGMVYSEFTIPKEYNVSIVNDQLLLSKKENLQKFDLTELSDDFIIFKESKK